MQYSVYDTQCSFDETGKEEILMKTSKQKLQIAFCRSGQSVWIRFPLIGLKIDVGNHFESGFSPFYAHWYTNKISILRNQNHTPIDMYEKKNSNPILFQIHWHHGHEAPDANDIRSWIMCNSEWDGKRSH